MASAFSLHKQAMDKSSIRISSHVGYMHSESLAIHQQAMRLFNKPGLEENWLFEQKHLALIERFGRYPHRNAVLGRTSTAEEIDFLATEGRGF